MKAPVTDSRAPRIVAERPGFVYGHATHPVTGITHSVCLPLALWHRARQCGSKMLIDLACAAEAGDTQKYLTLVDTIETAAKAADVEREFQREIDAEELNKARGAR